MRKFRETSKEETTDVMESINFAGITRKIVDNSNPKELIGILNFEGGRKLNANNPYHYEVAKELLVMYIQMN